MALEILLIVMVFCNDALSILENVGELDVPLPTFLKARRSGYGIGAVMEKM